MTRITVTENELVAELRASVAPEAPADALTINELVGKTGLGKTALKVRLAKMRADGRLEVYRAYRLDGTGRLQAVPAYRIKPARDEKRKRRTA